MRGVFDDTDVLGEIAGGFIVLRRDFIEAHPEAARNFVEQSTRAADWSRENPDEARKVLAGILEKRGENAELAKHWTGFGLRAGRPGDRRATSTSGSTCWSARAACPRASSRPPTCCSSRTPTRKSN